MSECGEHSETANKDGSEHECSMVTLGNDQKGQNMASQGVPEPLGTVVKLNGSTYHQIERFGQIAIYEGPKSGMYEVVVIRVAKPQMLNGRLYPLREVYPTPESWGTHGFTFTSNSHLDPLNAAREKASELRNVQSGKAGQR